VAEWAASPEARGLRIAEINRVDGLHAILSNLPGLAYSEYQQGVAPGLVVDGIRCEDLMHLSYNDGSFDLLLTSETLEHIPDLDAALAEIHRVLAPGGRHVFTVPVLPGVPATFARASLAEDGTRIEHAPLICHPGGDVGYPVFTEFGADWPEILIRAGFQVSEHFGPATEDDLAQVFVCLRP
jgi:SAM-dependent methyltransferase